MATVSLEVSYFVLLVFAVVVVTAIATALLGYRVVFGNRKNFTVPSTAVKTSAFMKLKDLPEGQKDFIVFLIGFRVNSWPRVIWHTLRQFGQFGKFANSTFQFGSRTPNAKEGCLGSTAYGSTIGGDMAVVQYWRSFEDLWKFATNERHSAANSQFYRDLYEQGVVGIWHEAYRVRAGDYEVLYANMGPHLLSSLDPEHIEGVEIDLKTRKSKMRVEHGKLF